MVDVFWPGGSSTRIFRLHLTYKYLGEDRFAYYGPFSSYEKAYEEMTSIINKNSFDSRLKFISYRIEHSEVQLDWRS